MKHILNTRYKLSLLAILSLFTACHTIPETGRSSFNMLPESAVAQLATTSFQDLKKQSAPTTNSVYINRVDRVCRQLLAHIGPESKLPPLDQWEWVVFEAPDTINAFAMPGGKIGVYTGILKLAVTDDELAVVLGHEIAHVAAHHGNERLSRELLISGATTGLAFGLGSYDPKTRNALLAAVGMGTQVGISLPYSRRNENEADAIGLIYAAQAGYDPRVAPGFWEKMGQAAGGTKTPEFLSTHPVEKTRIEHLNALMPKALAVYNQSLNHQQ